MLPPFEINYDNAIFVIPDTQKIYGTKEYQDGIYSSYIDNNIIDPKIYLTRELTDIFNSVLSCNNNNNTIDSRISIVSGLILSSDNIYIDDEYLVVNLTSGTIIVDNILITIPNNIQFVLSLPDNINIYDCFLITIEYSYDIRSPLKFCLFLYNSSNYHIYNDNSETWNDRKFIYKVVRKINNGSIGVEFDKYLEPTIRINSETYNVGFCNDYNALCQIYIQNLIEEFYLLDIPYIPPCNKTITYGAIPNFFYDSSSVSTI